LEKRPRTARGGLRKRGFPGKGNPQSIKRRVGFGAHDHEKYAPKKSQRDYNQEAWVEFFGKTNPDQDAKKVIWKRKLTQLVFAKAFSQGNLQKKRSSLQGTFLAKNIFCQSWEDGEGSKPPDSENSSRKEAGVT